MEELVHELVTAGIAVELLTGKDADGTVRSGVRLRTFGKLLPRNKMIIAEGTTFEQALITAVEKAEQRRWESLDWSARPWELPTKIFGGGQYGLDALSGPADRQSDRGARWPG